MTDHHRTVDDVADAYVDEYAALDPYVATYLGVGDHDAEATDLSPDGFAERRALAERTLRALDTAIVRDERERVAGAAMRERLGLDIEMDDAGLNRALNVIESPMHWAREVFDLMPTDTAEQWATIAARLRTTPTALQQYAQTMRADADAGLLPARRQVVAVAEQCRRLSDGYFATFVAAGPADLRDELSSAGGDAASAFAEFGRFLTDEMAPRSREDDAVGQAAYAIASRYFLGAEIDLDETYEWGVAELARIEAEMAEVAGSITAGGSVDDAVAALDADPARRITGSDALQAWMQDLSDRTLDAVDGVHFDIPRPLRTLECRIAPTRDGGIYYTPPSDDFSRPGRMWWSVPEGVDEFSTWRETTTVFHEGVPGHHLQSGQVLYRRDQLNRWQRLLCWVSGHGEGWALYAERLMAELGHLDDPGDRLGMLDGQAFRAARVVVDIGVHLGKQVPMSLVQADGLTPGRWTPESAFAFLRAHCRMPDEFLRFELDRYLGWPGQAPSYKVGERIWLAARDDARRRQGGAFDLKEFHRAALDLGSLGLGPLEEALSRL